MIVDTPFLVQNNTTGSLFERHTRTMIVKILAPTKMIRILIQVPIKILIQLQKRFPTGARKTQEKIIQLGNERFEAFKAVSNEGQELWMGTISTFPPHSVDMWFKRLTYNWCTLLHSKDVYFENGREKSRSEALKRLLFRDVHIPAIPRITCEEPHQEGTPPHEAAFSRPLDQQNTSFGTR